MNQNNSNYTESRLWSAADKLRANSKLKSSDLRMSDKDLISVSNVVVFYKGGLIITRL